MRDTPARQIVRIVLIVVAVAVCLYLIYQVRRPLTWLGISLFLALALAGPVNRLNRHMRRGFAIAVVYLGLLAVPFALIALIVPPFITEGNNFAENLPRYSRDVTDFVERNERLRELNKDYDITEKLQEEADKLPSKLGGAATTLRDVGIAIVNSLFALITILVLTAFMLGAAGSGWTPACPCDHPSRESASGARPTGSPARWADIWRGRSSSGSWPAYPPTSCSRFSACRSARRWR